MMNNPVLNTILNRSSIRAYTDKALTDEQMTALKAAALASPTAMNKQAQRFYFVTDKALIKEIEVQVGEAIKATGDEAAFARFTERGGKVMYDAPLFVAIAIEPNARFSKVDAGIAVENLALAAKAIGLDSVILGMPRMAFEGSRHDYFKERLGISPELEFEIGIAIGNAAMEKTPHESDPTHIITID